MSNVPIATGAGGQDRFNTLTVRLEFLVHWLKLAAEDLSDMPTTEEHTSAAFVVQEATQDVAQLLEAFGTFDGEYDYTREIRKSWGTYASSLNLSGPRRAVMVAKSKRRSPRWCPLHAEEGGHASSTTRAASSIELTARAS